MSSIDPTVPFRAGLYCTLESKFSSVSFLRSAKIYGCLKAGNEIEFLALNCGTKNACSIEEKRHALHLLLVTLKNEHIYNEVLHDRAILSVFDEEIQYLTPIVLHDMHERFMLPGIRDCNSTIKYLEELFNNKRLAIWSKFSDICIRKNATDINQLSSSRYNKVFSDHKPSSMAWINSNKCEIDTLISSLKVKGYKVKKCRKESDMVLDLPNVVYITHEDVCTLSKDPSVTDGQLIIHDTLGCLGPHCFVNVLLQYIRLSNGLSVFSDRRRSFYSKFDEHIYPKLRDFDILIAEAKNYLQVAHIAILLQSYGYEGNILAFNVGSEKEKKYYRKLFLKMKINNVKMYGIKVTELHPIDKRLSNVLVAYVNPPCSHSAITNLVDFLSVEEAHFYFLHNMYQETVCDYTLEQLELLQFCLSLPKIEMVLYVTNSTDELQNESVIRSAIKRLDKGNNNGAGDMIVNSETKSISKKFEASVIPVNAEGFQKPSVTSIRILPFNGRNGCYVCPIVKKSVNTVGSDTDSFELSNSISELPVLKEGVSHYSSTSIPKISIKQNCGRHAKSWKQNLQSAEYKLNSWSCIKSTRNVSNPAIQRRNFCSSSLEEIICTTTKSNANVQHCPENERNACSPVISVMELFNIESSKHNKNDWSRIAPIDKSTALNSVERCSTVNYNPSAKLNLSSTPGGICGESMKNAEKSHFFNNDSSSGKGTNENQTKFNNDEKIRDKKNSLNCNKPLYHQEKLIKRNFPLKVVEVDFEK